MQVKRAIVVVHDIYELMHFNLSPQLFSDLPDKSLLVRLAFLDLASGKLPPVLVIAVPTLGCEYFCLLIMIVADYCCDHINYFHVLSTRSIPVHLILSCALDPLMCT